MKLPRCWVGLLAVLLGCFSAMGVGAQRGGTLVIGRILDKTGGAIPDALVVLRAPASGAERVTFSDRQGDFSFEGVPSGDYVLRISASGFAAQERLFRAQGGREEVRFLLQPAELAQQIYVTERISTDVDGLERTPGSTGVVTSAMLTESRAFTTDEALRKVAGIVTRGEEGFGLRPNIGVRGLNPTRSSQVLLLEDGLPLAYAPYGDNASYYHPPIDRFEAVEVVKGGGQILYGPRTVGAVVNYLTPQPPQRRSGSLTLTGGNRDYANGHARFGGALGSTGLLFDYLRKQGRGARENTRHGLNDFNIKTLTMLTPRQVLSFRVNRYTEDSQVTYSGLRESEYLANPRANPFSNDSFIIGRSGASLRHSWAPRDNLLLASSAFGTVFSRDWWRQSSNSNQRPNDSADPLCGGMANLHTACGNEGRLRDYYTWGLESRARASFKWLGLNHESDFGVRGHFENQDRRQENGPLPTSRSGVRVESNLRTARAFSAFAQNAVIAGGWRFTPGARIEKIHYHRTNRLIGVSGEEDLTFVVPGFGIAYARTDRLNVFAGAHRGFAPPRVEDVISNSTGASIELDPELSWNYEAGVRTRPLRALRVDVTFFRMDFENQIVAASVAGGSGATLTNAGATLHQGMEISSRWDWNNAVGSRHSFYWRTAYTWLPVASFEGRRFSNVPGFSTVSVTGNRLPYAAENAWTTSIGYAHARGFNVNLEGVYTGRQYADDLNTVIGSPDGQRGLIPGNALWNATLNYPIEAVHSTFFVTVKNFFDRTVVVDRTRGLLPGLPRLVQVGMHWNF